MTTRWKLFYEKQMEDAKQRELVESELENLQLGVQIAKLRAAENLSQTKLAARAEMNAPKISAMENEPRNLTIGTLIRMANALGEQGGNQAGPLERDETGTAEQAEKEKSKPAALKPKAAAPGPIGKFRVESLKFKVRLMRRRTQTANALHLPQPAQGKAARRAAALKRAKVAPWGSAMTEMRPMSSKSVGGR